MTVDRLTISVAQLGGKVIEGKVLDAGDVGAATRVEQPAPWWAFWRR